MADKIQYKLEQTKGNFKLSGVIVGITKEDAFKEGMTKGDPSKKVDPKSYRSLRFAVKTSPINIINMELYGAVQDVIYAYSRDKKDTKKISWKDRCGKIEDTYNLIGVNVTNTADGDRMTYADYDAVKIIHESFNDGDSVYVTGEVKPNSYVNSNGESINSFKYNIKSISIQKQPINLEAEGFEEVASFDHSMVIVDTNLDKTSNKVIVNAYIIGYADSFKPAQFVIHYDKNQILGDKFLKLKFGDYIKVLGMCINAPTTKHVEEVDEWGSEVPKGYKTGGKYINELRITAVDKDKDMMAIYTKRKYKEEDFAVKEEVVSADEPNFNEESDDELPFDI